MELRHLRCFLAVAQELHFARAAERLHIEQSPLSRAIKELEEELGVTLFARTTRSTRLTRAGALFLEHVPRVLTALEQARDTQTRVERNDVLAFKAKIDDCLDVRGVIVSANGFQSGAKVFADDNRITTLSMEEIPSIGQVLGMKLRYNVIPTELSVGTPFWTLFDVETGSPLASGQEHGAYALLFWSRSQAIKYCARNHLETKWQVRGLEERHLFSYILVVDSMDGKFATAPPPNHELADDSSMFSDLPRHILINEYCDQYKDQLRVRRVMPSLIK